MKKILKKDQPKERKCPEKGSSIKRIMKKQGDALKKKYEIEGMEEINPTTPPEGNQPLWRGEYKDLLDGRMKQVTQNFIDKLGFDLITWARNDDNALRVCEFFDDRGIGSSTYYSWLDQYPDFKERYLLAKRCIGRRRETGGLVRKYESSMVRSTLYQFLDEVREGMIWEAKLRKDEQKENSGTQFIVIEKVPESSIVKPRKVED